MWKRHLGIALAGAVAMGLAGTTSADDARDSESYNFPKIVHAAKDRVFPAVVFVRCIREDSDRGRKEGTQLAGSGVLISEKGEFLTNWHVVDRAREIRCLL